MKILKVALFLALGGLGAQAFADDSHSTTDASKTAVESYTYGTTLDIKKIIAISEIPNECGPVPAQMTYEDSKGQRHTLEYKVMGTGCSNG
jgi:hypothetical protein